MKCHEVGAVSKFTWWNVPVPCTLVKHRCDLGSVIPRCRRFQFMNIHRVRGRQPINQMGQIDWERNIVTLEITNAHYLTLPIPNYFSFLPLRSLDGWHRPQITSVRSLLKFCICHVQEFRQKFLDVVWFSLRRHKVNFI